VPTIIVHTKNPLDIPPAELDDLANSIRDLDSSYQVEITSGDPRGVAVTWWEVIQVHVPWEQLEGALAAALIDVIVHWVRNRFKKSPRRPKSATIYGPDEQVLKKIELKTPDADVDELV